MFDWLYKLLGVMLSFFNSITGSYALALLFYALVFKIVFLPFSIKQQKNQIKMAKLAPKIQLIKAKYKGRTDQVTMQKQQQEIMELQQKEGYSPLSGCLPLLLQLPLIMLLYAVIQNPISYIAKTNNTINEYNDNISNSEYVVPENIEDKYASFITTDAEGNRKLQEIEMSDVILALYKNVSNTEGADEATEVPKNAEITLINDIYKLVESGVIRETREERIAYIESFGIDYETIPDFNLFGVNLAEKPSFKDFSILVIIPFLAAIASWFSMWLTRKLNNTGLVSDQDAQAQASMKIMDLVMPLMTVFFAFNFSGMLGIYWVYQSVLGLGQSLIIAKVMPLPKYTDEELKEMRRAEKEAEKNARQVAKAQPKHKSLHYIDEDDYDELPETPKTENDEGKRSSFGSNVPEIKD